MGQRSVEREVGAGGDFKAKRTASAQGLDRSTEGEENGIINSSGHTAHRRRTDLVPTLVMSRNDGMSRSGTPSSSKHRSPGISRENSTASRPGSAMSGRGGVRLRSAPGGARRPRPMSIATTGMTASMYEERQKPTHVPRQKSLGTPKADRMKRARSVTSDTGGIEDDNRSTTRKTPSQVKAEAAARKAKATAGKPAVSAPKSSLGSRGGTDRKPSASKSPSPAMSQDNIDNNTAVPNNDTESNKRQSTPDIIKDNSRKVENGDVKDDHKNTTHDEDIKANDSNNIDKEKSPEVDNDVEVKESKKMITSEEEAKARIAEKRREMKEQKEREAELERLRLEEEARLEQERLKQEEEEERKMIAFAEEARKAEEERIQKAIEEKEAEDKRAKDEEAEKRETELQEKLRKEEEERLARKKRIEE